MEHFTLHRDTDQDTIDVIRAIAAVADMDHCTVRVALLEELCICLQRLNGAPARAVGASGT